MKPGDRLRIEGIAYSVTSLERDQVILNRVRRPISARAFSAGLIRKLWLRPSVSADFLVHKITGRAIDNDRMRSLGIPSKRIERLHATLPLMEAPL